MMMPSLFVCPSDGRQLTQTELNRLDCPVCHHTYPNIDGIWHFLSAAQKQQYQPFIQDYETIRRAEGRQYTSAELYRTLPYTQPTTPLHMMWQQRAHSYEQLLRYVIEPLEMAAPQISLTILDLGAGNGWLSNQLSGRKHHLTAVDLTINTFDGLGCHQHYLHRFTPVQASFDQLPILQNSIDLIIFNASFHYTTSYTQLLEQIWPLFRPGGTLAIVDTPVYRQASNGHLMVAEREKTFTQQYGFPSNHLNSENFLTYDRINELANQYQTGYRLHQAVPVWRQHWRQLKNAMRGNRETAQFPLIVLEKA